MPAQVTHASSSQGRPQLSCGRSRSAASGSRRAVLSPVVRRLAAEHGEDRIGRDRRKCEISLPDRAISENILWHPSVNRGGTIRTRTGEVSVDSFTSDSIMVAGRHAEIDLQPLTRSLAARLHCT